MIAAVAVHSLFYNAFFEDPTVWAAIGLAAALPRRQQEPAEPPPLDRQVEPERQQDQRVDGAQQDGAATAGRARLFPSTVSPTAAPAASAIRRHWYGTGKTCCARIVIPKNITR